MSESFDVRVLRPARAWFASRGWSPHAFQIEAWRAWWAGESGLIHVPTGAGKTLAAWMAPAIAAARLPRGPLRVLWISPLRAMARDQEKALRLPVEGLELGLRIERRTGDTPSSRKARQRLAPPDALITTPESLALLLAREEAPEWFAGLQGVVVDEWHELLGSKRGVLLELCLSRLRAFAPDLRTWALSATVASPEAAGRRLLGRSRACRVVQGGPPREVVVETLLPSRLDAFPWAGHLGLAMVPQVAEAIRGKGSCLVFTNTRAQAERWYHALLDARPELAGEMGLHHGSLAREARRFVETELKAGRLRVVVATSSLDLGVDYGPVELVVQVGSVKGIGRLLQRAGRGAHRPGTACRLLAVPTHGLELLEFVAARRAVAASRMEDALGVRAPMDVLVQHLVTCAMGGGLVPDAVWAQVRDTCAYARMEREKFDWALRLVRDGGDALGAYPSYRKVVWEDGAYRVVERAIARRHLLAIGTIASDASVEVRFANGRRLGHVEERFLSRLKEGEVFLFAGRALELVRLMDGYALVRASRKQATSTPRWMGGQLPISTALGDALRSLLDDVAGGKLACEPEVRAAAPILAAQREMSALPGEGPLLAEIWHERDASHLFVYPLEGRLAHEGLAALLALRLARLRPGTFSLSVNDYGLEIMSAGHRDFAEDVARSALWDVRGLAEDLSESVNVGELACRQFREVARVAGLLVDGFPGARRSARQLQASSRLLWEVFRRHDPGNLLVVQAEEEALSRLMEEERIEAALRRAGQEGVRVVALERPGPFAFPLVVERMRARLSTETLHARIERMKAAWESASLRE